MTSEHSNPYSKINNKNKCMSEEINARETNRAEYGIGELATCEEVTFQQKFEWREETAP